jgi:hypothetical protein
MIASYRSVIVGLAIAAVGLLCPGLGGLGSAGFPATFSFRGKASPSTRRFSHFAASMTAQVASGWSGCRVGLAPTGKRRLVTAHTLSGHWGHRLYVAVGRRA